jgi:hypothetical protein
MSRYEGPNVPKQPEKQAEEAFQAWKGEDLIPEDALKSAVLRAMPGTADELATSLRGVYTKAQVLMTLSLMSVKDVRVEWGKRLVYLRRHTLGGGE